VRSEELKSPFERVSAGLFIDILSFSDAPSLAFEMGTCKRWRDSIGRSSLITMFEMEGKVEKITQGLEVLAGKSKNSLRKVVMRVTNYVASAEREQLRKALSSSSSSLQTLAFHYSGELESTLLKIAFKCPSLIELASGLMFHDTQQFEVI